MEAEFPTSETGPSGGDQGSTRAIFASGDEVNLTRVATTALLKPLPGTAATSRAVATWYFGSKIAACLGLPITDWRYYRDEILTKGSDWMPLQGQREFVMSRGALDRVLEYLRTKSARISRLMTEEELSSCAVPPEDKKGGLLIKIDGDKIEIRKW